MLVFAPARVGLFIVYSFAAPKAHLDDLSRSFDLERPPNSDLSPSCLRSLNQRTAQGGEGYVYLTLIEPTWSGHHLLCRDGFNDFTAQP